MIWLLLILFCSFWGTLLGLGEVIVAFLWIVQDALTALLGQRLGGAVMLAVICVLLGLAAYYFSDRTDALHGRSADTYERSYAPARTSDPPKRSAALRSTNTTQCGRGTPPAGLDGHSWSEYECQQPLAEDAAACLPWDAYTRDPNKGCPGSLLCCDQRIGVDP